MQSPPLCSVASCCWHAHRSQHVGAAGGNALHAALACTQPQLPRSLSFHAAVLCGVSLLKNTAKHRKAPLSTAKHRCPPMPWHWRTAGRSAPACAQRW